MNKKLRIGHSLVEVATTLFAIGGRLLLFAILIGLSVRWVLKPIIRIILNFFLSVRGYPVLFNQDIRQFFLSFTGIIMGLFLLSLGALIIYLEFSSLLYLLKVGHQKESQSLLFSVEKAIFSLQSLKSKETLVFLVYATLFLPLFSLGFESSLIPSLSIPNFVVGELEKYPGGILIIPLILLFGTLLFVRLILVLPYMVFQGNTFIVAVKKSYAQTKGSTLRILAILFITLTVSILLLVLPLLLFFQLQNLILLPLKLLSLLLSFTAALLLPSTQICSSLIIFQHFVPPFTIESDEETKVLDSKIRRGFKRGRIRLHKKLRKAKIAFFQKAPPWLSKRPYLLAVFLLVPTIIFIDFLLPFQPKPIETTIIGHRGSGTGVENTLPAIEHAITAGATMVEVDILLSKDQQPMVIHDTSLMRLAGAKKSVYELTAKELQAIPLSNRGYEGQIPTLDEVCKAAKNRTILMIELKSHGEETLSIPEQVVKIVAANGMESQVVYQTQAPELLQEMKIRYPNAKTGYILYGYVGSLSSRKILAMDADFLCIEESFVTSSLVKASHRAGKPVYVWTVNNPEDLEKYYDYKVDGLVTDYPLEMGTTLASIKEKGAPNGGLSLYYSRAKLKQLLPV